MYLFFMISMIKCYTNSMKKSICAMLCALMMLMNGLSIAAENEEYQVIHLNDGSFVASFDEFEDAYALMKETNHGGVSYQGKLIAMETGVAVLNHDRCDGNISTVHHLTDETGYVNGCYGNDALYLRTNTSGTWVLMQMAGAQQWVKTKDVTLVPYQEDLQLSTYFVDDGHLYHQVKTRWSSDVYGSLIDLGFAPDELSENQFYYSYDGHYFYTDFLEMQQDVLNGTRLSSVNKVSYYNYFMMLPHRSMSSYSAEDFNNLFHKLEMNHASTYYVDENKDSINDVISVSQLIGSLESFVFSQAEFGSNALLMLALSMNESASGNSSLAYRRNNLFGHAAYDSDVEGNAKRYLSVQNSVISHARNYISMAYANPDKYMYHGSFLGDKNSGMGVSYASDPYWSEKAAQYAFQLDEMLGQCDLNREALAIVENQDIVLYDDQMSPAYLLKKNPLMSFVIIGESNGFYRVQLDENQFTLNGQPGSYDFIKNTAFIKKSNVDMVLNKESLYSKEFNVVLFNAGKGVFLDGTNTKMLQFEKASDVICEFPVMDGAVFDHWVEISDHFYEAAYRKIDSIEMHTLPDQVVELNVPLSLKNGSIKVNYEDGTSRIVDLNMSMVSGYDLSVASDQNVIVTYGGASTFYPLHVSDELDLVRTEIFDRIDALLESDDVHPDDLFELKDLMQKQFYPVLTMNQIRKLDMLYKSFFSEESSMIISDHEFDLQISGLYLSLNDSEKKALFKDILKIDIVEKSVSERLVDTAAAQGWTIESEFIIDMIHNGYPAECDGPLVYSILKPDQMKKKWAVMTFVDDEVIQCQTLTYLNRICFKSYDSKEYVLVSKTSVNESYNPDVEEVITSQDNDVTPLILTYAIKVAMMCILVCIGVVAFILFRQFKLTKRSR